MLSRRTFCLSSVAAAVTPAVASELPIATASVPSKKPRSVVYLQDVFGASCFLSLQGIDRIKNTLLARPYVNYKPVCLDEVQFVWQDGVLTNMEDIRFPESAGFRDSLEGFAISDASGKIHARNKLDCSLCPLPGVTPIFSKHSIRMTPQ